MQTSKIRSSRAFGLVLFSLAALNGCAEQPAGPARDAATQPGEVRVCLLDENGRLTGVTVMKKVVKTDEEWRKQLTKEQYQVARGKGTEPAFCGAFYDHKKPGIYSCVCCGLPLFSSQSKFDSGTGWPSFFAPVAEENVVNKEDLSHGTRRTEILCARCDAHLGHVFDDGPRPTGLRYCLNSVSLVFTPQGNFGDRQPISKQPVDPGRLPAGGVSPRNPVRAGGTPAVRAAFAAGCFWGVEATFRGLKGVTDTAVGYMGGTLKNPTYKDVCTDKTGHAETVQVEYDPAVVSYEDLLKVFWENHDPTTLNRQGPDSGTQYRSVVFYYSPEQQAAALACKDKLQKNGKYKRAIVTEIVPAPEFYRGEEYHQRYLEKRGLESCGTH